MLSFQTIIIYSLIEQPFFLFQWEMEINTGRPPFTLLWRFLIDSILWGLRRPYLHHPSVSVTAGNPGGNMCLLSRRHLTHTPCNWLHLQFPCRNSQPSLPLCRETTCCQGRDTQPLYTEYYISSPHLSWDVAPAIHISPSGFSKKMQDNLYVISTFWEKNLLTSTYPPLHILIPSPCIQTVWRGCLLPSSMSPLRLLQQLQSQPPRTSLSMVASEITLWVAASPSSLPPFAVVSCLLCWLILIYFNSNWGNLGTQVLVSFFSPHTFLAGSCTYVALHTTHALCLQGPVWPSENLKSSCLQTLSPPRFNGSWIKIPTGPCPPTVLSIFEMVSLLSDPQVKHQSWLLLTLTSTS